MSQDNNEAASAPDFIVCGRAGNRRYDLEQVLSDALAASASQSSTPVPRVGGNTSEELPASVERSVQYIMDAVKWYADHKDESTRTRIEAMVTKSESLAHVARQRQESAQWVSVEQHQPAAEGWYPVLVGDPDDIGWATDVWWRALWRNGEWSSCDAVDDGQPVTHFMEIPALASASSDATPSAAVAEGVDTAKLRGLLVSLPSHVVEEVMEDITTYGAQQREAGRREQIDRVRLIEGQRDIAQATCREFSKALDEAELARQPVSEGLTLARALARALDAAYPIPDSPHGSVKQRAHDDRLAFKRGYEAARAVPPAKAEGMSAAAQDVLAERQRQVSAEGWTPAHDDAYQKDELQRAAMCYLMRPACDATLPHALWPWDFKWWKPADDRRNLVKAGALLLAEIERIDRLAQKAKKGEQQP